MKNKLQKIKKAIVNLIGLDSLATVDNPLSNKTLYVHIGAYKTGTTYLQNALNLNRKVLSEESGLVYLQSGLTKSAITGKRHHYIVHAIEDGNYETFQHLETELNNSPYKNFLISCEFFSRFTKEQITTLKEQLPNLKVKIVYTVRKQDEFIESMFAEYTQHNGNKLDFEEFVKEQAELLNHNKIIEKWGVVFGIQNILVSGFESNKEFGLVESFLNLIDLDSKAVGNFKQPKNVNPTLDEDGCNFMFNLNHSRTKLNLKWIGHFIAKNTTNEGRRISMFTQSERMIFLQKFEEENLNLIRRYKHVQKSDFFHSNEVINYKTNISVDRIKYSSSLIKNELISRNVPKKFWENI